MSGYRLSHGGSGIDRGRPVGFTFDGRRLQGFEGDTLASALIANGVGIVGRSFKYHRLRGVFGSGFAEPNALVQVGEGALLQTNVPATRVRLEEGLVARSLNAWPSLSFDLGRAADLGSGLLAAGFYYKTFMWPAWKLFEGPIRAAAGIGRAPTLPDPGRYEAREANCDVLVVGAGAAGLAAAAAAARSGAEVVLMEADERLGGGIVTAVGRIDGLAPAEWVARLEAELTGIASVRILRRTTAMGYYDHNFVAGVEEIDRPELRQRLWKLRARQVILACGAFERPLLFAGNDLPGVMLAGAVHEAIARHGVGPGHRIVVATVDDSGLDCAIAARAAGVEVAAIVDQRAEPGPLNERATALGIPVHAGAKVMRASGARGVRRVEIAGLDGGDRRKLDCDLLAVCGGWTPAVQLFTQSGGALRFDAAIDAFVPGEARQAVRCCGAAAGTLDLAGAIAGAAEAGHAAAVDCGFASPMLATAVIGPSRGPGARPADPDPTGKKVFVDLQTDVTLADMALAVRENYRSIEHVKRYTVWGMGVDQGRLSAANGVAALAMLEGELPQTLGAPRHRPPFAPAAIGVLAAGRGRDWLFRPWRRLPAHRWHEARGAVFEHFGYQRPSHYPRPGEDLQEAALREARAARNGVGVMDSSSFGKIELKGPEAGVFLDRVCAIRHSDLDVGRVRYNLMLDELGTVIDDGVVSRLGPDHFLLTASSAHAERISRWLEEWRQCEWPLDLVMRDVTSGWAVLTLAGPRAREVLETAETSVDLDPIAFPAQAVRCGRLGGAPVRIQRVSFTGELSFEINIPAGYAEALANRLWDVGRPLGLVPFGLDALDILRIEKGFLHIGSDTESSTQPGDIGVRSPYRRDDDFLGRRSLFRSDGSENGGIRRTAVGLQPADPTAILPIGAHVLNSRAGRSEGFVTSSCFSPALDRSLALALLDDGDRRLGEAVTCWSEGRAWSAVVTPRRVFDPQGARMNG